MVGGFFPKAATGAGEHLGDFSESTCARGGRWVRNALFFDSSGMVLPSHRSQRWEPREIRGRLRHCDGLQASKSTGSAKRSREGGSEARNPKVRTSAWFYARRVPPSRGRFSVQEKDEARPLELFFSGSRMPSFPVLPELEGFLFSGSGTGLQTVPPTGTKDQL